MASERRRVRANGFIFYAHLGLEVEEGDLGVATGTEYAGMMTKVTWAAAKEHPELLTTTDMLDDLGLEVPS